MVSTGPAGLPQLPDDLPAATGATPLSGGDIARVWRVSLADGRTVVVKATGYDATLESEGLTALADAGAPVPRVLAARPELLVLDHVGGPPDLESLGAALAGAHRHIATAFGWHRDNVIGPLPQANPWTPSWPAFYVEHRLSPYLDDLPSTVATRLQRAMDGPLPALLDHDVAPSLVHGDLWSGNIVAGRWLIDPAVHHADRELDLAMLELFGTIPAAFTAGYDAVWPLDDGAGRRRGALQLYHLLVHVRLFGSGYVGSIVRRLDALGW